jgi:hypothetical protein
MCCNNSKVVSKLTRDKYLPMTDPLSAMFSLSRNSYNQKKETEAKY